eukprot:1449507-Rhodomonas_salina.6
MPVLRNARYVGSHAYALPAITKLPSADLGQGRYQVNSAICLRPCYAKPGTDMVWGTICLRALCEARY